MVPAVYMEGNNYYKVSQLSEMRTPSLVDHICPRYLERERERERCLERERERVSFIRILCMLRSSIVNAENCTKLPPK